MQVFVLKKVKPEKLQQWKDWCTHLMTTRKEEAVASFKVEQVLRESCTLFLVGNEYFALGYMESKDGDEILPGDPTALINIEHKKQREECLEGKYPRELLYDLRIE